MVPIRPLKRHTAKYEAHAPRQLAVRHSLPVRPAAGDGVRTQSTPNEEAQEFVLESETDPARASTGGASSSSATQPINGEHESGSTPHIQGDGLIPAAAATDLRPENDLRRADVPGRPNYGDRSPIFAVPL